MSQESQPSNQGNRVLIIQKSGKEHRYVVTDADYLDLARALDREGPPKLGVAWTLVQRFAMLYPLYSSFSTFVKAYAQPINPDWFAQGKRHLKEVQRLNGDLKAVARENQQAALREQWSKVPLSKITTDTKQVINSIFAGTPSPIPAATHYAAPITRQSVEQAEATREAFARKRNYSAIPIGNILTHNWFYGESQMRNVSVRAAYAASLAIALLAIVVTSGAGLGVLYVLRRVTA